MAFRGFFAVEVGPRPALVRILDALAASRADLKVVAPENLHVTLKFLGTVADEALPALETALRASVTGERAFVMRLDRTGTFPPRGAPRVHWVGLAGADALGRIAERLEAALEPLGWPREARPFSPHVTLARARTSRGADAARRALEAAEPEGEVAVDRVVLFRSLLSPRGPTYEPVLAAPLGA